MKALGRSAKSVPGGPARKPSTAHVQAKARPGAGNRLRQRSNLLEAQAGELAERAVRGEKDLGGEVSKTSAAGYRLPSSPGSPLPPSVREEMERAFHADFGAVRVHTGNDASAVAQQEHARAFTSGADIFFGRSELSPHTHEGRLLIAHELTHVLQQTGRRRADGRSAASRQSGSGELQRQEFYDGPKPFPNEITLTDLAAKHRASIPSDQHTAFDALVATLRGIVGDQLSLATTGGPELGRRVKEENAWGGTDVTTELRGLVVDALKATGQYEAAGLLMAADPLVRTIGHLSDVFDYAVVLSPEDWELAQLEREPLRRYFPWQFVDTYRRLLFGPTRAVQNLYAPGEGRGDFGTLLTTLKTNAAASTGVVENELFFSAFESLRQVDNLRIRHTQRALEALRARFPDASSLYIRHELAVGLRAEFSALLASAPAYSAADRMLIGVLGDVVRLCERAAALWLAALQIARPGATTDPALLERWRALAQRTELQTLREGLLGIGTRFFALDHGDVPSAAVYRTRVSTTTTQARQLFFNQVEARLIALARIRAGTEMDEDLALAYAVLLDVLPAFTRRLDQYDATADRTFVGGRNDVRVAHRLRVARWIGDLGIMTGWTELVTLVRPVLTATGEGQRENQVAILGEWTADTAAQIADFADDRKGFSSGTRINGLGFLTPYHVATMFLIDWYETVTREVAAMLSTEEANFTADVLITPRIRGRLADFAKPRRFVVEPDDYEVAYPELAGPAAGTAVAPVTRTSVYDLVMQHPKTQAKLHAEGSVNVTDPLTASRSFWVSPVHPPDPHGQLYFWTVPPLEPVVRHLREIPGLEAIVLAAVARARAAEAVAATMPEQTSTPAEAPAATPAQQPGEEALPDVTWLEWIHALTTLDASQLDSFAATLSTAVAAESGTDKLTMIQHLRRAFAHDRRIVTQFTVRPKLARYDGTVRTYLVADEALEAMQDFVMHTTPPDDRDGHLTLMLLDLFRPPASGQSDIAEIVGGFTRYDLIIAWQALLRQSVRRATDNRASLVPILAIDERGDDQWIDVAVGRMNTAIAALEERKRTAQLRFGFAGVKARGEDEPAGLMSAGSSRRIPLNEPFQIDGVSWTVIEVLEDFQFFPDYGLPGTGSHTPSILTVNGVDVPWDQRSGAHPASRRALLRVTRGTRIITIHEHEDEQLEELSHAVGMQVIVAGLQELAEFIESATEAMLELAEFIPGAGQAIMAARLAASIIAFIASDEFAEIKEMVFEDPLALFDPLKELINGELFTAEHILEWLVMGGGAMAALQARLGTTAQRASSSPRRRPRRARPRSGTLARFAALVQRVWGIGAGLGRALGRTRNRARRAYVGLGTFVLERPLLVTAFRFAGNHIDRLEAFAGQIADLVSGSGIDLSAEVSGLSGELGEIIAAINEIEIPREIVPIDQALEIVINLVLDRLGAKYRIGGRAILYALDALGLKQDIFTAIADQVPDEMNPNHYWAEFVESDLQPRFESFRTELIASFSHVLTVLGLPQVVASEVETVSVEPAGDSFPETEALFSSDRENDMTPLPELPSTAGTPLDPPVRTDAEARFGHDFSHVRLHVGGDAASVTDHFGADGITSGSHVYLRPGLSPQGEEGARVLRHELTHVLQQTGLRPLGGAHGRTPVVGRRGRGLRFDTSRESEAARSANAKTPADVRVTVDREEGPQPRFSLGTLSRLMRSLSRGDAVLEFYRRTEERSATAGTIALPAHVTAEVAHVGERLWSLFSSGTPSPALLFDEPFDRARAEISSYFTGRHTRAEFQNIVNAIALQALVRRTPRNATPPAGGGQVPKIDDLHVAMFRRLLEGEILNMGLGIRLDFNGTASAGEGGLHRFRLDAQNPIQRARVLFLFMAEIPTRSAVWDTLMLDTFNAGPGSSERNRLFPRATAWLSGQRVAMGLWDRHPPAGKKLVLSLMAKTAIEALLVTGPTLAANELPHKNVYLARTPTEFPSRGSVGFIGLHLGVYRDAAQTGSTKGRERESHHTTQFLLLEYFRNWKDDKPFKHDLSLYPGMVPHDNLPATFNSPTGGQIHIRTLTGDSPGARGPGMPTLSLAAVTHNNNIHVQAEKDDAQLTSPRSAQSYAVKNAFRRSIGSDDLRQALFAADDTGLRALTEPHTNPRRAGVQQEIFDAMQSTYRFVRGEMFDRLGPELRAVETTYYNNLSAQSGGPGDQVTGGEMDTVLGHARTHNDNVFAGAGWTAS